jgi:hypothetical protein
MEAGANVQPSSAGSPEQVNWTALLYDPDWGCAVTLTLPLPPALMLTAEGLVPRVKLLVAGEAAAQLKVNVTGPEI